MKESQFPETNHWRRKILRVGDIPIVLHDHRAENNLQGAVTVERGQVLRANVADADFINHASCCALPGKVTVNHIVAHIQNRDTFAAACFPEGLNRRQMIVLQSTTSSSLSDDHADAKTFIWLSMKNQEAYKKVEDWIGQFLELSIADAKKIAALQSRSEVSGELEYLEDKYSKFLNVILPGSIDAPLALHLLCEAWICTNGKESKIESGIMVHAPQNLNSWLRPFAIDDEIPTKQQVVAVMAKSQRNAVLQLLDAVEALDAATGEEAKKCANETLAFSINKIINLTTNT